MKKLIVLGALILAGCQTAGAVEPIKPTANPNKIMRSYLNATLKDPGSLQNLKISGYFKLGPRNIWKGHYAVCSSYSATNSYGGRVQGGAIIVFKPDGQQIADTLGGSGRPTSPECRAALQ